MQTQDITELKILRDLYNVDSAIESLESQAQNISKEFKQGIRQLKKERASVEAALHDGTQNFTGSPESSRSPCLTKLINDPCLANIPDKKGN
jgi:phage-related minor tail protein